MSFFLAVSGRFFKTILRNKARFTPSASDCGFFSDWNVTRIVICGLLIPFFLIGANWVREAMNLTCDNDYECRGAVILLLSAIVLAVVVSGLVVKAL